jgi:hypothetical protein
MTMCKYVYVYIYMCVGMYGHVYMCLLTFGKKNFQKIKIKNIKKIKILKY